MGIQDRDYYRNEGPSIFDALVPQGVVCRWLIGINIAVFVMQIVAQASAQAANPFPDPFMAATAKVFCNEMSLRVTSEAVQLHGGFGFTDEYPVSRFYRGARYGSIGGGTSETLRDLMGRKIVGDVDFDQGILGLGTY